MMKKLITNITIFLIAVSFTNFVKAAKAEITWTDYEKYRDIHPSNESRKHFRERTFYNFEKHFNKLAAKLSEGQVLKIEFNDVDLAGDTRVGGIDRIRIVKDIYFPKLSFSYQYISADGTEIFADSVILKDISFLSNNALKYRNDSIGYEKNMIDKWFFKTFEEHISNEN